MIVVRFHRVDFSRRRLIKPIASACRLDVGFRGRSRKGRANRSSGSWRHEPEPRRRPRAGTYRTKRTGPRFQEETASQGIGSAAKRMKAHSINAHLKGRGCRCGRLGESHRFRGHRSRAATACRIRRRLREAMRMPTRTEAPELSGSDASICPAFPLARQRHSRSDEAIEERDSREFRVFRGARSDSKQQDCPPTREDAAKWRSCPSNRRSRERPNFLDAHGTRGGSPSDRGSSRRKAGESGALSSGSKA